MVAIDSTECFVIVITLILICVRILLFKCQNYVSSLPFTETFFFFLDKSTDANSR